MILTIALGIILAIVILISLPYIWFWVTETLSGNIFVVGVIAVFYIALIIIALNLMPGLSGLLIVMGVAGVYNMVKGKEIHGHIKKENVSFKQENNESGFT